LNYVSLALDNESPALAGLSHWSMSLDVYSHVMPPDEVPSERFLSLIHG